MSGSQVTFTQDEVDLILASLAMMQRLIRDRPSELPASQRAAVAAVAASVRSKFQRVVLEQATRTLPRLS